MSAPYLAGSPIRGDGVQRRSSMRIAPEAPRCAPTSKSTTMARAMRLRGVTTKRAAVEEALRLLVRIREQAEAARSLKGLGWEGDLDEMRNRLIVRRHSRSNGIN